VCLARRPQFNTFLLKRQRHKAQHSPFLHRGSPNCSSGYCVDSLHNIISSFHWSGNYNPLWGCAKVHGRRLKNAHEATLGPCQDTASKIWDRKLSSIGRSPQGRIGQAVARRALYHDCLGGNEVGRKRAQSCEATKNTALALGCSTNETLRRY